MGSISSILQPPLTHRGRTYRGSKPVRLAAALESRLISGLGSDFDSELQLRPPTLTHNLSLPLDSAQPERWSERKKKSLLRRMTNQFRVVRSDWKMAVLHCPSSFLARTSAVSTVYSADVFALSTNCIGNRRAMWNPSARARADSCAVCCLFRCSGS